MSGFGFEVISAISMPEECTRHSQKAALEQQSGNSFIEDSGVEKKYRQTTYDTTV